MCILGQILNRRRSDSSRHILVLLLIELEYHFHHQLPSYRCHPTRFQSGRKESDRNVGEYKEPLIYQSFNNPPFWGQQVNNITDPKIFKGNKQLEVKVTSTQSGRSSLEGEDE